MRTAGSAAFNMAWFHPELYHRVLIYPGAFGNQQSGPDPPHGAWRYHESLIPNSPAKPLRVRLHVSERDNGATSSAAGFHNGVLANQRMAAVLKAKGHHYSWCGTSFPCFPTWHDNLAVRFVRQAMLCPRRMGACLYDHSSK